jgi:hypothetical protein
MTFQMAEARQKMLDTGAQISKVVGGITFDSASAITVLLDTGRGTWADASFQDSNVKGNSMQGAFAAFQNNSPLMYGAEGSAGASGEFADVVFSPNLFAWKAFDQLAPSKKSWIVAALFTMQDFEREELVEAMQANSPLPTEDIEAIVSFISSVSQAYINLLEHVAYIDEAIWQVKSKSEKKSKSTSSAEKEEKFKEAFSSLGLLS